jgi:type II secretory pathway component PulF
VRSILFRLVIHGIAWGLFALLCALGIPRIEMFFDEYDIPLPRLTTFVIRASDARAVLILIIPVLLGADWYVLGRLSKRGDAEGAWYWSTFMIASPLLLIVLMLAAFVLPLLTIDDGLSG